MTRPASAQGELSRGTKTVTSRVAYFPTTSVQRTRIV
jgi:hypothetical protein